MAATKTSQFLLNNVTTTTTSAAVDVSADYADTLFIRLTQVGTATTAPSVQISERTKSGSLYYSPGVSTFSAQLAAGTYDARIPLDPATASVQVIYTQQVGGTSSACTVEVGQVTGI